MLLPDQDRLRRPAVAPTPIAIADRRCSELHAESISKITERPGCSHPAIPGDQLQTLQPEFRPSGGLSYG